MRSILLLLTIVLPIAAQADDCDYSKDLDFTVDASTIKTLRMDVGSGSLEVIGDTDSDTVQVRAKACSNSRSRLADIDLTHQVRGPELIIRTEFARRGSFFSWIFSYNSYIDIEVRAPSNLVFDISDSGGSMEISGVATASIKDGSGGIEVSDISGDVSIDDGSGSITVRDVRGLVSVSDGSGGIVIADSNDVLIIDDGSGGIQIENINRNVDIEEDGSGGITIRNVAGDVDIGSSGSGSVNVSGITGTYNNSDD